MTRGPEVITVKHGCEILTFPKDAEVIPLPLTRQLKAYRTAVERAHRLLYGKEGERLCDCTRIRNASRILMKVLKKHPEEPELRFVVERATADKVIDEMIKVVRNPAVDMRWRMMMDVISITFHHMATARGLR